MKEFILYWNHTQAGNFPAIWLLSQFKDITIKASAIDDNHTVITITKSGYQEFVGQEIFKMGMAVENYRANL